MTFTPVIENMGRGIEFLGVAVIAVSRWRGRWTSSAATARRPTDREAAYRRVRRNVGQGMGVTETLSRG